MNATITTPENRAIVDAGINNQSKRMVSNMPNITRDENWTWAIVSEIPNCDLCRHAIAYADGKMINAPWAYMCKGCFLAFGVGLGVGMGQELLTRPPLTKTIHFGRLDSTSCRFCGVDTDIEGFINRVSHSMTSIDCYACGPCQEALLDYLWKWDNYLVDRCADVDSRFPMAKSFRQAVELID